MIRTATILLLVTSCATSPHPRLLLGLDAELERDQRWEAADHYEAACQDGAGGGCLLFEYLMMARRPSPSVFNAESARWEAACEAGDGRACFRFGMLFDDERGFALETPRALRLYERSCELGYDYACQRAANLYVVLFSHDISVVDTRALCVKSCTAGYGRACVVLADLVKAGKGGPRNSAQSRDYLRRACQRGRSNACIRLAKRTMWLAKKNKQVGDTSGDLQPLLNSLRPACDRGHPVACLTMADVLGHPLPVARTVEAKALVSSPAVTAAVKRAREREDTRIATFKAENAAEWSVGYFRKRCDAGSYTACFSLAAVQKDASGDPQGRGKALLKAQLQAWAKEWRAQCDAGVAFGCVKLINAYQKRQLPAPSEAEVVRLKARAGSLIREMKAGWTQ